ncbi:MAG TPA: terminase [Ruminococcaceae bacterium]|nr:MAG TPA: terminase large subunit [Caudoviricetes sp.]HBM32153.1 terminase [Oscillospiraceae bacterium]HCK51139.1 terminase [Oscillospiraceae bacterium]
MKPPEDLTVSQWADKNRRLTSESSAEVGKWRTSRTPYMFDILDSFTDPLIEHIVVVAASQVGKSETINNMVGYCIDQDPGPILLIQPTIDDVKRYSEMRIAPMIRETRCLKRKVADPKSRDAANTKRQKSFPGGVLVMTGSNVAHDLSSMPIRYVFGDERDRWATSAGSEGDPWELAVARTRTFYNKKMVEVSTPTVKGASAIENSYNLGTMERWKTQCPHCGEYVEITFDNIRFEYEAAEKGDKKIFHITELFYVCPECGGISDEHTMKSQPAKWVATVPEARKHHKTRSFWLTAWVSPWATWESIILQFLQAGTDSAKLQVVYNTQFGELWEERGDMASEDDVMARREVYEAEVPDGVLLLTCGVDTQDDRLEYEVVGHRRFGETWGIKKGVILGRPDTEEVWERLDEVLSHKYKFKSGVSLQISLTFIDEGGHFTQEVRQHCLARQYDHVFAIKGANRPDIPYTAPPKKQKIVVNGKVIGQVWVYEIGVNAGKQKIVDNLRVQSPGANYCHFPLRDDYGKQFFKQLMSEHLAYVPKLKHPWQWQKIPGHERNEAFDIRNYNLAACEILSPDWDAIEQKLRTAKPGEENASIPMKEKKAKPRKRKKSEFYDDW